MQYQGWSNYETWAVSQRFGEYFSELGAYEEMTPTQLRDVVEQTFMSSKTSPLELEFITRSMGRVNWEELAVAYAPEHFLVDEY